MGQTHGVEQHLAQLLGAVGIKGGAAGLHVDAGQHLLQFLPQLYAELLNAVLVHQHAGAGHVGKHLCQRELDLVVQRVLAAGGDLGLHPGKQVGQPPGVRVIGAGKGGSGLVGGDQLADLILGGGGVQQIGGQLAVPDDAAAPAVGSHGLGVQGRSVEHIQRHIGVVQQPQQLSILQRVDGSILHGVPAFRLQYHVAGALLAGNGGAGSHQIMPGGGQGQGSELCFRQLHSLFLNSGFRRYAVQPEPGDQGVNLQLLQKPHGSGFVALAHGVGTLGGVDGGIGADGAQRVAQLGHGLIFQQVLPLLGFDALVVNVLVHALQRAEGLHQREGGLFADALHAGDVIRGIAHQALHLDELLRRKAVFFLNGVLVHHHGLAASHHGGSKQHGGALAHQLQAVPVSGGKEAVVLAGSAGSSQCTQNIVRLPALGGNGAVAKVCQQLLEHRHLLCQLLGHGVAGGLVAIVHFMPEGGGFQIKSHSHLIRLALLEQGEQNVQKAIDGVGITSVLGGQQLDAVKSAVGNAVAVNDQ